MSIKSSFGPLLFLLYIVSGWHSSSYLHSNTPESLPLLWSLVCDQDLWPILHLLLNVYINLHWFVVPRLGWGKWRTSLKYWVINDWVNIALWFILAMLICHWLVDPTIFFFFFFFLHTEAEIIDRGRSKQPSAGLDPGSLPEPKADNQPLSHPGVPLMEIFEEYTRAEEARGKETKSTTTYGAITDSTPNWKPKR